MFSDPMKDTYINTLHLIIKRHAPSSWQEQDLNNDLPLGDLGLGLDSITVTELLIACEDHFGVSFPLSLIEETPLTVGTLIAHLQHDQ